VIGQDLLGERLVARQEKPRELQPV
jgi:hypothetical protein